MSATATHLHHRIDYIELGVTDLSAAKKFYADAFGWAFNEYGPAYAGIRTDPADPGAEIGGLNGEVAASPGGPLVLLYSDHLDATLRSVTDAGGTVVARPYEFPGGRRFHFADPSGNVLGVWATK
jgi:uncharacterized protein